MKNEEMNEKCEKGRESKRVTILIILLPVGEEGINSKF